MQIYGQAHRKKSGAAWFAHYRQSIQWIAYNGLVISAYQGRFSIYQAGAFR